MYVCVNVYLCKRLGPVPICSLLARHSRMDGCACLARPTLRMARTVLFPRIPCAALIALIPLLATVQWSCQLYLWHSDVRGITRAVGSDGEHRSVSVNCMLHTLMRLRATQDELFRPNCQTWLSSGDSATVLSCRAPWSWSESMCPRQCLSSCGMTSRRSAVFWRHGYPGTTAYGFTIWEGPRIMGYLQWSAVYSACSFSCTSEFRNCCCSPRPATSDKSWHLWPLVASIEIFSCRRGLSWTLQDGAASSAGSGGKAIFSQTFPASRLLNMTRHQLALDRAVLPTCLGDDDGLWCLPAGSLTRQVVEKGHSDSFKAGRPGPKSRDMRLYPQRLFRVQQSSHSSVSNMVRSHVDARVGGSKGHYPPGAAPIFSRRPFKKAKHIGPVVVRSDSFTMGTPEDRFALQPTSQYSQALYHTFFLLCVAFLQFCLSRARSQSGCICFCTCRLLPGHYRRRRCESDWRQRRLDCLQSAGLSAALPRKLTRRSHPNSQPGHAIPTPYLSMILRFLFFIVLLELPFRARAHPSRTVQSGHQAADTPNLLHAQGSLAQRLTSARKRSFKRAQIRALKHGSTTYRRQVHTLESLALRRIRTTLPKPQKSLPWDHPGLRVVSWNAGGLHSARYQETLQWLSEHRHSVHILCIQESKWGKWAEYSTAEYQQVLFSQ